MLLDKIKELLAEQPNIKAKEIAKRIGFDKKEVNAILYKHKESFFQNKEYCWCLNPSLVVTIDMFSGWVSSISFEEKLKGSASPLSSDCKKVIIEFPEDCQLLLETIVKLLAFCNQMTYKKKNVTLDFKNNLLLGYLSRVGFFDYLSSKVSILPERPSISKADTFRENSDKLMELRTIDVSNLDTSIPIHLKNSFVSHTSAQHSQSAFTVISELFSNVCDHSDSATPGLAALQMYASGPSGPHIQTIISDNGKGIIGTLRPVLATEDCYASLQEQFSPPSDENNALLIKWMFANGRISRSLEEGRGLGLKRSGDIAAKFNATISIRQENFEVTLIYRDGIMQDHKTSTGLATLYGTHICFDFLLTNLSSSR